MSLLNEIIKDLNEEAAGGATGGGSVAGYHGSLFNGGVVARNKRNLSKIHNLKAKEMKNTIKNRNKLNWKVIGEMMDEENFDTSDVMSKLDAAEKQADTGEDTTPFGLEDEDGNIVKVYVKSEQSDDFESALGALLAGETDEDDDDELENTEIAEILFKLKDKFDIIDVQWPKIEGDEEEETEMTGNEDMNIDTEGDAEGEGIDMEGGDEELDIEGDAGDAEGLDMEGGDEEMDMEPDSSESTLQQVIDMMKSDAEARKAESEARAAEAEARAAEAHAQSASSKVEQEEQILDMEEYNKQKKSEKNEAETLAKLAKHRHEVAREAETTMAENEEENYDIDELAQKVADLLLTKRSRTGSMTNN